MLILRVFLLLISLLTVAQSVRIHPSSPRDTSDEDELLSFRRQRAQQPVDPEAGNHGFLHSRRLLQGQQETAEDHRITSLPLLGQFPTDLFAGHLPASADGDRMLFYWLVAPPAQVRGTAPLLIWMNGGPGCSSMEGFFLENGPLRFVQNPDAGNAWELEANPDSWHLAPAWVLYVDQPVGTGLSFTKSGRNCENDLQINTDFHFFLEEFLLFHRNLFLLGDINTMNRPLFFSGESHAGHYIPSMIDFILRVQNQQQHRVTMHIEGAAIGNGWIDPYYQYAVTEAAYAMGLINLAQKAHLDQLENICRSHLGQEGADLKACYRLLDDVVNQSYGTSSSKKINAFNARKMEDKQGRRRFPEGYELVETYLGGRPHPQEGAFNVDHLDVLKKLHATQSIPFVTYQECADPPYLALEHQDGQGTTKEIANLLDAGVKLLFYNGMDDLICNHISMERALLALTWNHAHGYQQAPRYTWTLENDAPVGYVQQHLNLTFLKILNAGHMVPKDQSRVAFEMIQNFLKGGSFASSMQHLDQNPAGISAC